MTVELKAEVRREVEQIFEDEKHKLGVEAVLDLGFLDRTPITGKNVYGEASPFEEPPRVKIEVFAPDATDEEITEVVLHELVHVKCPYCTEEMITRMTEEELGRRFQKSLEVSKVVNGCEELKSAVGSLSTAATKLENEGKYNEAAVVRGIESAVLAFERVIGCL